MKKSQTTAELPDRYLGRANVLILRSLYASRRTWWGAVTGFIEPILYLTTMGLGLGAMVGAVYAPDGVPITYAAFIAPALLAATTMNAAFYDLSIGFYFKLRHARLYEAVLTTPTGVGDVILGETLWTAIRGAMYATAFVAAMFLVGAATSVWALAAIPVAFLVAFAFGLVAMAGTTYMRSWSDTQLIQLVTVPMLLFATTFFPLDVYPGWLQPVVQLMPLYQANILMRSVVVGAWPVEATVAVLYLAAIALLGAVVSVRRLEGYLLK